MMMLRVVLYGIKHRAVLSITKKMLASRSISGIVKSEIAKNGQTIMGVELGIYLSMAITIVYAATIAVLAVQSARRESRGGHARRRAHRLPKGG